MWVNWAIGGVPACAKHSFCFAIWLTKPLYAYCCYLLALDFKNVLFSIWLGFGFWFWVCLLGFFVVGLFGGFFGGVMLGFVYLVLFVFSPTSCVWQYLGVRVSFCPLKWFPGKCVLVLILNELHNQASSDVCGGSVSTMSFYYEQRGGGINGMNINNGNEGLKFSRSWADMKRDALKCV